MCDVRDVTPFNPLRMLRYFRGNCCLYIPDNEENLILSPRVLVQHVRPKFGMSVRMRHVIPPEDGEIRLEKLPGIAPN